MKSSLVRIALIHVFALCSSMAQAAPVLTIVPHATHVQALQNLVVDVIVSGLHSGGTNLYLGAFDLTLSYDASAFQFLQANSSLGMALGDPTDPSQTAVAGDASTAGLLRFMEVSFLEESSSVCTFCTGPFLSDLQTTDSFKLATLAFYAPGQGGASSAAFGFDAFQLIDGGGQAIGQVGTQGATVSLPEPGSLALAAVALGVLALRRRPGKSAPSGSTGFVAPSNRFQGAVRLTNWAAAAAALIAMPATAAVPFGSTIEFQGHHYYLAPQKGLTWDQARAVAARETLTLPNGTQLRGHLLTINSQAEQNFIVSSFRNAVDTFGFGMLWLGGYQFSSDVEPLGNWAWITGEESGDPSLQWSYSSFTPGQPGNDANPTLANNPNPYNVEDAVRLLWFCGNRCGRWDDFNRGDTGDGNLLRFVIEFDAIGDNFVQLRSPPAVVSNSLWRSSSQQVPGWQLPDFNDANWAFARSPYPSPTLPTALIPGTNAQFMWHDPQGMSNGTTGSTTAFFRYTFSVNSSASSRPLVGTARVSVDDDYDLYVNGTLVKQNHDGGFADVVDTINMSPYLRQGKNVIAVQAVDGAWGNAGDRLFERVLIDATVQPQPDLLVLTGSLRHSVADARRYDGRAGAYIGRFGAGGCNPTDATYGPDNRLYVLDQPSNDFGGCSNSNIVGRFDGRTGLQDLFADPFGSFVPRGGFTLGAYGMAFGPDGNLYISDFGQNSIQRFQGPYGASPGAFIDTFVTPGSAGLREPSRLVFGPDSNLYVVAQGRSVLRFQGPLSASPGAFMDAPVTPGAGGVDSISDIAFGRDKMLYVAARAGVMRFQGPEGNVPGLFVNRFAPGATAIAFGADGDLYSDAGSGTVLRFDGATGASKGTFASGPAPVTRILFSAVPDYAASLGDFNRDGCIDQKDLALLTADLMGPAPHNVSLFDLTGDGQVTIADSRKLVLLYSRPQGAACR